MALAPIRLATMMTSATIHTTLLESLQKCVAHQREIDQRNTKEEKRIDESVDTTQQLFQASKDGTKHALFQLLLHVSQASKDELDLGKRQALDNSIHNVVELKWPLLRALEDPSKYRAFLGLPRTMEQTRIY